MNTSIENKTTWNELLNRDDFQFCYGDNRVAGVADILTKHLFGSDMREPLATRYTKMHDCFRDVSWNDERWNQGKLKNDQSQSPDCVGAILDVPASMRFMDSRLEHGVVNQYFNCGHDLPIWMGLKGTKRPRVMIIGQDPQRQKHEERGHLYLSSPWACHSSSFKKCTATRDFFARLIVDAGCDVYLTDYAKLYFTTNSTGGRGAKPTLRKRIGLQQQYLASREGNTSLKKILRDEVLLWNPELIITMGKWIENYRKTDPELGLTFDPNGELQLEQKLCLKRVLTLYHPASAIAGGTKKYFNNAIERIKHLMPK